MKDDGGQAFPSLGRPDGMTMRQFYKGRALAGLVYAGLITANMENRNPTWEIATWAGSIADAMIAEDKEARDE